MSLCPIVTTGGSALHEQYGNRVDTMVQWTKHCSIYMYIPYLSCCYWTEWNRMYCDITSDFLWPQCGSYGLLLSYNSLEVVGIASHCSFAVPLPSRNNHWSYHEIWLRCEYKPGNWIDSPRYSARVSSLWGNIPYSVNSWLSHQFFEVALVNCAWYFSLWRNYICFSVSNVLGGIYFVYVNNSLWVYVFL